MATADSDGDGDDEGAGAGATWDQPARGEPATAPTVAITSTRSVARMVGECIMATVSARFGRYELIRPLGQGGMAEVFLARYVGPEGFEKRLVIKRVLPQMSDDRRLLRMFFEEARTQVSLSHGNLVSVFDFGRVGNEYFIAMEHVEGADLATLVSAER